LMMAMRRVRCGSSVYVQKKSSWSWAACACCFSAVTVKLRLAGSVGGIVAVVVEARIVRYDSSLGATRVPIERVWMAVSTERAAASKSKCLNAELPWLGGDPVEIRAVGSPSPHHWLRHMIGCETRHPPLPIRGAPGQTVSFLPSLARVYTCSWYR
jgi:hypothetical protein